MLNYIWLGLILLGIGSAVAFDISDTANNKYKNGKRLTVNLEMTDTLREGETIRYLGKISLNREKFNEFYSSEFKRDISKSIVISGEWSDGARSFYMETDEDSPQIWIEMAAASGGENDLLGKIYPKNHRNEGELLFENITLVKLKEVTNATLDYAAVAVEIALGLIGIMALWLGIMRIADKSGVINSLARFVRPLTSFLFPDVPKDHPAISAIIMNISANMLGLGNAATPFGIKAMEELDKLNPEKGTATNSMCTFLAVNTAGLTLIPTTAIAVRAAAGSADPTIIIGTSIFGATCATITGITVAKLFEKLSSGNSGVYEFFKNNFKAILSFLAAVVLISFLFTTGIAGRVFSSQFLNPEIIKTVIQFISILAIPLIIFSFLVYGVFKKIKIYEEFVEGAKEGFNVALKIIPYLVAMLVAIGIFRAGGAMEFLVIILNPITGLIGFPAEALPMALMRPLSGSGSIGIMTEIISVHGSDSFLGVLTSTFLGSTETTLYVLAVYFGAVNIKRTRHAAVAGLLADIAGILGALFIVKLFFGV